MGRKRLALAAGLTGFLILTLLTQTACTITIGGANATISGTVYGDSIPLQEQGISKMVPISGATVSCGKASTKTDQHGQYHLSLAPQKTYDCIASAPNYQSEDDSLDLVQGNNLTLNFGPASQTQCDASAKSKTEEDCEALNLSSGSLSGVVTYAGSKKPVANAVVKCVSVAAGAPQATADSSDGGTITADAHGAFTVGGLATDPYTCAVLDNSFVTARQSVTIAPNTTTNTTISVCSGNCHPVHYHGGSVMRTLTAYLIFWQPWAYSYELSGSNTRYESLMKRFIQDLQGTSYYNLLTQYWDFQGNIQNQVTLGGTYVDHTPYQHCALDGTQCTQANATSNDPLYDADIGAEVSRALKANPTWSAGQTHEFFVFTAHGAEECQNNRSRAGCTFSSYPNGFCAYHSFFYPGDSSTTAPSIYAYIPDSASEWQECAPPSASFGPNGDSVADMTIDFLSHELFESVSDPLYNYNDVSSAGWFNDAVDAKNQGQGEIGDLCAYQWGPLGGDGGDVTLQHGDRYIVQTEWSNRTNSCALS